MFGQKKEKADLMIFALYDTKAKNYRDPIMATQVWDIVRDFESMVRAQKTDIIIANAEDFQVFKIGEYTRHDGAIISQKPEHVLNLHELKASVLEKMASEPRLQGH